MTQYIANLEGIISNTDMPAAIRLAAMRVKEYGYLSVKDFLEGLSSDDLELLLDVAELLSPAHVDLPREVRDMAAAKLMALTFVMAAGDGAVVIGDDNSRTMLLATISFLTLEGMARKGVVDFNRANASYSDDSAPIARLTGRL